MVATAICVLVVLLILPFYCRWLASMVAAGWRRKRPAPKARSWAAEQRTKRRKLPAVPSPEDAEKAFRRKLAEKFESTPGPRRPVW